MSVSRFFEKHFQETPGNNPKSVEIKPKVEPIQDTTTQKDIFHIFTDGACTDNGKKSARGGFGVHFYSHDHVDGSHRRRYDEYRSDLAVRDAID
jgi:hypothetical protein